MEILIGKLADACSPQIAEQYFLDNVLAAEGIAKSIMRKEIGGLLQRARTHPSWTHEVLGSASRATARRTGGDGARVV
jgi:hypothetical protein